ncbi:MAG TPA: plasmid pRiA4b ORF-3 family protein [Desulfobacteraceae bacterium]|nr:plasmid pRiA4b ORF-3 family protein [Desulfobacteraceae bacterium]HPJ68264.1 plasmid pRiA4b ORF-3 family protein [Desulfobacteraceae bacterium]HPQ27944.1 plasmid pRiA4b ORF-3 family protein [Desulfobacteraceae bacterium]
MKVYQFRVSIIGIPKLYRIIEASENCTFDDLHDAIFQAFDRFDEHLYSFFITRKDTKDIRSIYDAPEIAHPMSLEDMIGFGKMKKSTAKTRIGDADLNEKDVFHYLFDFGDDWWHRIKVQKINETKSNKKYLKIIKSVGESPPQYPDYNDDYDEEYE